MNILLAGISAKFIHQNLAVDLLAHYAAEQHGISCGTAAFTINQSFDAILSALYRRKPDLLGFSCYIWNWELVKPLVRTLKKVLPATKILLGGPEVSFDAKNALAQTGADFVLVGEGEEPFSQLCLALLAGKPLDAVPSLTWVRAGAVQENPLAEALNLEKLPFVFDDFSRYENRILYYEAQRGCPFNCQYCLSSAGKGVRFAPLDKVAAELQRFLQENVRQVKFVDRTFNANPAFAMGIWRYLNAHDNGRTNFHFELEASLLTDEQIAFLAGVRPGLFQFEIGVQSTHAATLSAIDRREDFQRIRRVVRALQAPQNIHLHLDLIAGLPLESLAQFAQSFNDVYALAPDQFQLGFLKLLKGSGLRRDAARYGILWRDEAPYEVLATDALPYGDLLRLKEVEDLLERYYNARRFCKSLEELVPFAASPFDFYAAFADNVRETGQDARPHALVEQYDILYQFGTTVLAADPDRLRFRMEFDLYSHEKARKRPAWMPERETPAQREWIYAWLANAENRRSLLPQYEGLEDKQVYKMAHIAFFPFDPQTGAPGACTYLFNYRDTDLLGNARVTRIGESHSRNL